MMDIAAGKESLNPRILLDWLGYQREFIRLHPTYFDPDGLLCFCGPQGSGKTLSAVNYVCNLMAKYPKAKLVTNIMIEDYPIVNFETWIDTYNIALKKRHENMEITEEEADYWYQVYLIQNRVFPFNNSDDLVRIGNDEEGVICLIDEIQLYYNSLESKNINPEVMTQISQQRKQRKHIVCTSQVFGRMAKPLREQFASIIVCRNYFRCLQRNRLINRDDIDDNSSSDNHVVGKVSHQFFFWHNPRMYKRYDTSYVIDRNKFVSGENIKGDIYDHDRQLVIDTNNH